ncbi:MAG: DUF4382 domain-containing protein [Sphingobacteriales bacterium]|nr:DUF4382 domain-containing protein [Sphingobacteriales bacterium]
MKNIIRIAGIGLVITSILLLACQKDIGSNTPADPDKPHSVTIYLTDHQTPIFDSVFIDLQQLEVKLEDDSLPNGGWVNLTIRPGVYNILRFRNGLDTLFATGTLPNARIKKIRLTLGTRNSAMLNGQTFNLLVKDEDRQVVANLESNNFEITTAGQVLFWIDFDAGNSIQVNNSGSGNNNGYRLKSHIKIFTRSNSGRIEGRVLPRAANPIVKAIIGSDTATAIPDTDGEFKIVGLNAGTYKVLYDGQNGYLDTTINNVVVRNREDTHLPLITLHQ